MADFPPRTGSSLTALEWSTLALAASGRTYGDIAHELGRTEQTIKNRLGNVRARLGVESTLAAFAAVGWLVVPPAMLTDAGRAIVPARESPGRAMPGRANLPS